MLKLAPHDSKTSYIAAFDAARGLCFAASAILGGVVLDWGNRWTGLMVGGLVLSFFPCLFVFGWIVRSLGALLLLWVVEPTAKRAGER